METLLLAVLEAHTPGSANLTANLWEGTTISNTGTYFRV